MIVGTAGHIDHGKTSLVKALTGVDADRLPEEKARGITLDLGYAYTTLADGQRLGFIDVPGHERLIHTMLAGATGIDFALLVVAADDGPMPQTREHVELLGLLDVAHGAVALTKVDAVTAERRNAARQEIAALLAGSRMAAWPRLDVSAHSGEGIAALHTLLATAAASHAARPATGGFRLAIDRCFSLAGAGTVVTGTAHSGRIAIGDTVAITPLRHGAPALSRVRSLHVNDRPAEAGQAGQRCALALAGDIERSAIERGMWLVDAALAEPLQRFHGELQVPPGQVAVRHWQAVHVHLGTADLPARVALLEGHELAPGQQGLVEIVLDRPALALRGDRFVVRDAGGRRTVAGGRVLDIHPPARHKRRPERLDLLRGMRAEAPAASARQQAAQALLGLDLTRFAINWNLAPATAAALWRDCGLRVVQDGATTLGFAAAGWAGLRQRLLDALAAEHARAPDIVGVERERLRRMTQVTLARAAFDALVAELLAAGELAQTRAWLHLPSHQVRLSEADRALYARLRPLLDAAPCNPPRVRDVARATGLAEDGVRQLLRRVGRGGEVYPVAHDHYFTAAAVAALAAEVRALCAAHGSARAAALRDRIGGGRKVAIQILEFFDRVGYTRRVRDEHVLRHTGSAEHWTST